MMKKKYEKPVVIIEDFSLSATIAGDCEFKTSTQVIYDCGYETRNGIVFMETVTGCKYHEPDENDALCYHVPNDYANIFNS